MTVRIAVFAAISLASLCSGCVSLDTSGLNQQMANGLQALVGEPSSHAFDVLGYPTQETAIEGRVVYLWARSGNTLLPIGGSLTQPELVPVNLSCQIRMFADPSTKIILSFDFDGTVGGCEPYRLRLSGRQ